jgi:hypothetical protein
MDEIHRWMVGLIKRLWLEALGSMDPHLTATTAIKEWSWTSLNNVGASHNNRVGPSAPLGTATPVKPQDFASPTWELTQELVQGRARSKAANHRAGRTSLLVTASLSRLQVPPPTATDSEGLYIKPGTSLKDNKWLEASGRALHKLVFRE